jgi:APA family basic amino acid/polyamine antiporter
MPFVPIIGVVFSLWLITFLAPETWLRFGLWFLLGGIVWAFYGRRKSKLAQRA